MVQSQSNYTNLIKLECNNLYSTIRKEFFELYLKFHKPENLVNLIKTY